MLRSKYVIVERTDRGATLDGIVREGFSDELTFKQGQLHNQKTLVL